MSEYFLNLYKGDKPITLEVTVEWDSCENWSTGDVQWKMVLDSVILVHGKRRREVLPILTEQQKKDIIDCIEQENRDACNE